MGKSSKTYPYIGIHNDKSSNMASINLFNTGADVHRMCCSISHECWVERYQ